jgi:hypothetical protein
MKVYKDVRDIDQVMHNRVRDQMKKYCPLSDKFCKQECINYEGPQKYHVLIWYFMTLGKCKFFKRVGDKNCLL